MGILSSNKELSTARIDCGGSFQVKLSLTAAPDILINPTDIVLILDRSGSMEGSALFNLKVGARTFIDIIDEATDSAQDGQIGGGSRIGIVSFAGTARQDTQLITSVSELKAAVNSLAAGGDTNHADAFTKALELLEGPSDNARVMVMFTDGNTTTGPDPGPIAAAARDAGVVIYTIGLRGAEGVDVSALEDWASKPSDAYVAITPNEAELEELFADLAKNISKPGATDVVITDTVAPCFRISSAATPTKGTAAQLDGTTVQWQIDELGATQCEGAVLTFDVEHVGPCSGTIAVNESITYSDKEGSVVTFPSPELEVDCGVIVIPEGCPEPVELEIGGCEDAVEVNAGDLVMGSLGRILQLSVTLQNVCPGRQVALAVILTEVDDHGIEYKRGMKTMVIPAHSGSACRNVNVRGISFVLPESQNVSGTADSLCSARNFKARFLSNYIENSFECCNLAQ